MMFSFDLLWLVVPDLRRVVAMMNEGSSIRESLLALLNHDVQDWLYWSEPRGLNYLCSQSRRELRNCAWGQS
jgi:hypothetical protein